MRFLFISMLILFVLAHGSINPVGSTAFARAESGLCKSIRGSEWTFTARPYLGEGYESRPVVVSAIRTLAKNLTISEVRIRNLSSKPVSAVRIGWTVVNDREPKRTLSEGVSQLIPMETTLAPGDTTLLKFPLVSFSEVGDQLSRTAPLKGRYEASVFVSDISFEDASKWKLGDKVSVQKQDFDAKLIKAAFAKNKSALSVMPLSKAKICPKQACDFVNDPTNPGYTCKGSENEEYCTNCLTSCCSTICSDPSPSCGVC